MSALARLGTVTILAGALVGCASTGAAVKRAESTTLASGWRVDCNDDQAKAERSCFAGTFDKTSGAFFQVRYVNGAGPTVFTPEDFPGRVGSVRVDNGPVVPLNNSAAIVSHMEAGKTAYVVWNRWPSGEQRMTIDVEGFAEAHQALKTAAGLK